MKKGIAVFANTLSASLVFRASLLKKLNEKGYLNIVCAFKNDVSGSDNSSKVKIGGDFLVDNWSTDIFSLISKKVLVIHSFTHSANVVACFIALVFRKKLVMTVTGMGRLYQGAGIFGLMGKTIIRAFYFISQFVSSVIIVQNQEDYKEINRLLIPFSRCLIRITPGSGIPVNYFSAVSVEKGMVSEKINVGFFSRALPQKGVSSFYKLAASRLDSAHLKFIHVGLPGVKAFSAESILSTAEQSGVSYMGYVSDLRTWLLATDIVVIPSSYREGVSRLLIESMLAGKVVVAKNTTGVVEHIKDGITGFLYSSDEELSDAFDRALSALGGPISGNAKAYAAAHFNVALVDEVYFDSYRYCGLDI